jgi:phage shock protein E
MLLAVCLTGWTTLGCQAARPTSAPAGSSVATTAPVPQTPALAFVEVDPERFARLAGEPDAVVLDVRSAREHARGHLAGDMLLHVNDPDFDRRVAALDPRQTYLVYCHSGGRSATACKRLADAGFTRVYNLRGGIVAWQAAGKPLEK